MKYRILGDTDDFGVAMEGLAIGDFHGGAVAQFKGLLANYGFVVLAAHHADDETFVDFLRLFGELTFTPGETAVAGFPSLNEISNVGRATAPRSTFHVDSSYLRRPPAYTALRAVIVPDRGGETEFTNQYRACETLPLDVRNELAGRTITHVVTGLDLPDDAEREAEHPIFRRHPISDRTALYMSTPQRCAGISGMTAAEGQSMVAFLYSHCTQEANVHRHRWSPGDLLIWDNTCVMHRGDHSEVSGDRVLHRGLIAAT